jgi:hypothetical protein
VEKLFPELISHIDYWEINFMSSCPVQTFNDIPPEKWLALKEKASQNGINLDADAGQITQRGFTFSWQYDSGSATLTIQCLDHPFLIPCSTITDKINDLAGGIL